MLSLPWLVDDVTECSDPRPHVVYRISKVRMLLYRLRNVSSVLLCCLVTYIFSTFTLYWHRVITCKNLHVGRIIFQPGPFLRGTNRLSTTLISNIHTLYIHIHTVYILMQHSDKIDIHFSNNISWEYFERTSSQLIMITSRELLRCCKWAVDLKRSHILTIKMQISWRSDFKDKCYIVHSSRTSMLF